MFAVPDAPVSHGRPLAHCAAAVIVTFQLYALAELTAANIDAATTAATTPPRRIARRLLIALMVPPIRGSPLSSSLAYLSPALNMQNACEISQISGPPPSWPR